jgi:membrane protein DedA with SNARE-associated domain
VIAAGARASLRPSRHALVLIGVAVVVAALLVGARELLDPSRLPDALAELTDRLGAWTYGLVGAMALLETGAFVGLVAPGETVVVVGGLAAQHGEVSLPAVAALAWVAALTGDSLSFAIGRRYGHGLLARLTARLRLREERLRQLESFFERHGGKTVLLGRFIGFIRALAPFLAGASGLRYRDFLPWSLAGTGLWALSFTLVGYAFAASFESATGVVTAVMVAIAAAVAAAWLLHARRRGGETRAVAAGAPC